MAQVSKDPLDVSSEFIESSKLKTRKKKGGPYSKDEKVKRQNEVYRLHFEYGYSARKISELMKISRNTINGDINFWYYQLSINNNSLNPEANIILSTERLDVQRTRLRENLDKAKNFQQRQAIEKMIFDIESKIITTHMKLGDSMKYMHKQKTDYLNDYLKKKGESVRYMNFFDRISVSEKAYEKISKIIKDDRVKTGI